MYEAAVTKTKRTAMRERQRRTGEDEEAMDERREREEEAMEEEVEEEDVDRRMGGNIEGGGRGREGPSQREGTDDRSRGEGRRRRKDTAGEMRGWGWAANQKPHTATSPTQHLRTSQDGWTDRRWEEWSEEVGEEEREGGVEVRARGQGGC